MPQPKDKDWMNGYKNKTPIYSVYKEPPQNKGNIQTEIDGLEKRYFMQVKTKTNKQTNKQTRSSNNCIR